MFFVSNSKINKLVLLRRELYPVSLCLFKTAFVNLAKYSTVLFYVLIISKKIKIINKLNKVNSQVWLISYTKKLFIIK
jgi:hypothetical protein